MRTTNFLLFALAVMLIDCEKDSVPVIEFEHMIMADGKNWTTKNLDILPKGYEDQVWWYDDDEVTYAEYGRLYTWEAAIAACQQLGTGWRLPTNQEWYDLTATYGSWSYIGGNSNNNDEAYEKLILDGDSGLDALLGGYRDPIGTFDYLGTYGGYWSGTEGDAQDAWFYYFVSSSGRLFRFSSSKAWGLSCRCLQDN